MVLFSVTEFIRLVLHTLCQVHSSVCW